MPGIHVHPRESVSSPVFHAFCSTHGRAGGPPATARSRTAAPVPGGRGFVRNEANSTSGGEPGKGQLGSFVQSWRHGRSCDFDCRRSVGETRSESGLRAASRPRKRGTPNGKGWDRGPRPKRSQLGRVARGKLEVASGPDFAKRSQFHGRERAGKRPIGFVCANASAWTDGPDCANNDPFVRWTFQVL